MFGLKVLFNPIPTPVTKPKVLRCRDYGQFAGVGGGCGVRVSVMEVEFHNLSVVGMELDSVSVVGVELEDRGSVVRV